MDPFLRYYGMLWEYYYDASKANTWAEIKVNLECIWMVRRILAQG